MKKVLSIIIIIILFAQLTACSSDNEKPNIKVYNYVNDYEAVLNIDNIKLTPSKGSMLAFESDLSAEEIMNALSESNPQITFIKLNNREFLAKYNENCPYILFSKNVCDKNENIVDDVCVVMSESEGFNKINSDKPYESTNIWYPNHLTNHYFSRDFLNLPLK